MHIYVAGLVSLIISESSKKAFSISTDVGRKLKTWGVWLEVSLLLSVDG